MLQQSNRLIACYEALLRLSARMCEAAQRQDWDGLATLQASYVAEVNVLKSLQDDAATLTDEERRYRYQMLETILSQDAAIRNLVMPQLARLAELINSSRRRQGLHHAYQANAIL
ncbi:flagellar protein FliT [Cupriavidus sp. H39]|uniref:flagellar protein FliT n=1 Tax=Cupriavidus sp. H39 TaxID=3401635 RepID=UPI003D06A9F7